MKPEPCHLSALDMSIALQRERAAECNYAPFKAMHEQQAADLTELRAWLAALVYEGAVA